MITDALHDVPDILRIEEADRQPHQFREEIGYQRDADPGIHLQGNPRLDKPHSHLGYRQYQLRDKDKGNKT